MGEGYSSGPEEPMLPQISSALSESGGIGFDSEWVRLLDVMGRDATLRPIVKYISEVDLTDRAKEKLAIYIVVLLDREFATSKIRDNEDFMRLQDDKDLLDADLPLGLTRFDISPEFQHIIDLLRIKFGIKVRRSFGGFERTILATQRTESVSEERTGSGVKSRITDRVRDIFR